MNNYKNLYDCLLESDDLHVMFDGMKGNWEQDKNKFIEAQTEIEELTNLMDVDLDFDDE